jgi:hypothetical protein
VAIQDTVISYSNLIKPFGSQDKFLASTYDAGTKVTNDPAKVQAVMDDLKTGLQLWQKDEITPKVLHTPRNTTAALLQSHVVREATAADKIEHFFVQAAEFILEGFEVQFASADWPDWAASFFTWVLDIVPARQLPPPAAPIPIGNQFSIGVLGDFGTGLYGAPVCQQSIQENPETYGLMLHLGDVYYSAMPDEVEQRFFNYWPNKAAVNYTMNGNHEMYTGGHTYFETMLPRFNQPASYLAMQNDHWVFAVLDTAYNQAIGGQEGVFDDPQMKWLKGILDQAGDRKVVLFSHHQPFTLLDTNNGGNLITRLEKYGLANRIFAWYWGHEHRCLLYDPHPQYKFYGRCVGHAAFPEVRPDLGNAPESPDFGSQWRQLQTKPGPGGTTVPGAWIYDKENIYIPGFETTFGGNGFMRLEFDGDHLVEYVRSSGNVNVWLKELTGA